MTEPARISPDDLALIVRSERELADAQLERDEAIVRVRRLERDYRVDLDRIKAEHGVTGELKINPQTGELLAP